MLDIRYPRNFTFNAFWQSRYLRLSLVSRGPYFPTGGGGNVQQLHKHFGQLELWAGSCHQGWGGSRLANTALDPWWPPLHLVGQPHWPVDPLQSQFQDLSQQVKATNSLQAKHKHPTGESDRLSLPLNHHHCIVFKQKTFSAGRVLCQRLRLDWHPSLPWREAGSHGMLITTGGSGSTRSSTLAPPW